MGSSQDSNVSDLDACDSTATSRRLLDRIKIDDALAWSRVIDLYAPLVYRWCRAWGLPEQEVADVLQEVFRAVSMHIRDFRKEQAADTFRGWLRTISQNKVRDHFRARGAEPVAAGGTDAKIRFASFPAIDRADDSEIDGTEVVLLRQALELVRPEFEDRTWEAFWQTAVEGRDAADAGGMLDMTAAAVRVAKARVLRRLRETLGAR
jgi:RNA polymerase sigma-70 factor (ECF subfamily)